ncbi:MAG: 23S rRNA (guanosine(2251)-2'-O)-methyltransferase RlmB [Pseudomonadota bacterium]
MSGILKELEMDYNKNKSHKGEGRLQSYWLYGIHSVQAAINNKEREIKRIVVTKPVFEKFINEFNKKNIVPDILTPQEINKILPANSVHQGLAAEVKPLHAVYLEEYLASSAQNPKPLIVLDQVSDPHNIGAILRSAAAFDAGAVIMTKDNAPGESAIMAKASSGGIEIVPIITVTNLSQSLKILKENGYWCIGLDGKAKQNIADAKLGIKTALIMGGEGRGLRRLTEENSDLLVKLPISPQMESLNVSNAAAIGLYVIKSFT